MVKLEAVLELDDKAHRLAANSGDNMPSVWIDWFIPAGPYIGTLSFFASSGASPRWSPCPCVTRIRSILPSASRFLYCSGVFGFLVRNGSIRITLPLTVVILVAD